MNKSPFIYGTTVSKLAFTNREAEVKRLRQNLTGGTNTIIISPRRWGKSSLVEKVAADISTTEPKIKVAVIDLFTVNSQEEFLETFAREVIKATSDKWEDWLKNTRSFFKLLIPKIQVSVDPANDFNVSFDWDELMKYPDEVLNLPETIANRKKIKMVVCIDEFQNLANINDFIPFERKMRALWQRQKSVTYCLYGSRRHMMIDIFNSTSKPFYRFGDIMLLPKITEEKWVHFICKSFKNTGKEIRIADATIVSRLMQNHSWYVQQLAHYTWNLTERIVSLNEIKRALTELIHANSPLYQREVEILSGTQINLLKAIANGETLLMAAKVMQHYNLGTPRNVSKNKLVLVNLDIISISNKKIEFLDPAFELWFREQYLNQHLFSGIYKSQEK